MTYTPKTHRPQQQQAFIMPAILFISLALAIIGVALLTYVSVLRLSVLKNLDLRIARDAALSGFEWGRDKLETVGGSYAGTTAPTNCSSSDPNLAPYTIQSTGFCATFKIEILAAPSSGASKQVRSTGIVYRLQGSSVVVAAQQVYVGNIAKTAYSPETSLSGYEPDLYGIIDDPSTGKVVFTAFGGNRIGMVTQSTGPISEMPIPLVAGTAPTELAVAPDNRVWFAQYNGNKLAYTSASAGGITEIAIPTANSRPIGLLLGPDNNIWYAGLNSGRIGKFNRSTNAITEYIVPTATFGSGSGPIDLATGSDGKIWFITRYTGKVGSLTTAGAFSSVVATLPTSPTTALPRGIVSGPDNNLWVTAQDTNKVAKIVPATGAITEYNMPTANSDPYIIARGNGSELWVTLPTVDKVAKLIISGTGASSTLSSITEYNTSSIGGSTPRYIVKGSDNNMWFTKGVGGRIGRISSAGTLGSFGVSTSRQPQHLVQGPDGNMWATLYNSGQIAKISPTVPYSYTTYNITEGNPYPQEIIVGPDNNLWFTQSSNRITRLTTAGAMTSFSAGSGTHPVGITVGPDNNLWFGDFNNGKIVKSTTAGAMTFYNIPSGAGSGVRALSRAGNFLWFTERYANKIGKINYSSGAFTEYTVPTPNSQPNFITTASNGDLWFTEFAGNKIGKITQSGVITEYPIPTANSGPAYIVEGPDGNMWFSAVTANRIGRITPGGIVTEFPPTDPGTNIFGINFGPDGNLWYAGFSSNKFGQLIIQLPAVVYKEQTSLVAFRSNGEGSQVL